MKLVSEKKNNNYVMHSMRLVSTFYNYDYYKAFNGILAFLESKFPVKTKWIVADFSKGEEIYKDIQQQLAGIPVGILGKKITFLYTITGDIQ